MNTNNEEYPKLSVKEFLILKMLVEKSGMYGLEMVEVSNGELKRGTIYPTLQRMAEKEYVESKVEPRTQPEIGVARRMYYITEFGRRVLDKNSAALTRMLHGELMSIDKAAEALFVSMDTLECWIEAGEIDCVEGADGEMKINKDDLLSEETKSFFNEGRKWETMRSEEAIPHGELWFGKAIESNERFVLAVHELGRMYFYYGHYYKAVDLLKKAVELNADARPPSVNLGRNYFEMQRYKDAADSFANVVRISPDFAKGWYELGVSLSFLGFYDTQKSIEAIEALRKARILDRKHYKTALFLSRLYTVPSYGILDFDAAEILAGEIKEDFPHLHDEIKSSLSRNGSVRAAILGT